MIVLKLSPSTRWNEVSKHLGTVYHGISGYGKHGVAASIHQDFQSTLATRRYMCGLEPANYQVPARLDDTRLTVLIDWFDWSIVSKYI